MAWLVQLSGMIAGVQTERLTVQFPVGHMPGLQARSPVGGM